MIRIEEIIKIENKYKDLEDGVYILSEKVNKNDAIYTMTNNFKNLLKSRGVGFLDSSLLSDTFGFSLVMLEEALEEERKERFFDFVSSAFSEEFLEGKEERLLFDKMLRRMERKLKREEKKLKAIKK